MTELELWKRIASNAHKVEWLGVEAVNDHERFYIANGDCTIELRVESEARFHRYAALLVVDAIEKAGRAQFERYNDSISPPKWRGFFEGGGRFSGGKSKHEHLSLLECIAYVLEGLE